MSYRKCDTSKIDFSNVECDEVMDGITAQNAALKSTSLN